MAKTLKLDLFLNNFLNAENKIAVMKLLFENFLLWNSVIKHNSYTISFDY